jgi:HEAT repeat protein
MSPQAVGPDGAGKEPRIHSAVMRVVLWITAFTVVAWLGATLWRERNSTETTRRLREALEQLKSESAAERAAGAGNLRLAASRIDMETAIGGLTRALADENAEVRTVAAQSLGWLIENARKPRPDQPADELLRKWTNQVSRALSRAVSDRDASVRASVLSALAATAHQPGSNALGGTVSITPGMGVEATGIHPTGQSKSQLETDLEDGSAKWSREVARLYYGYSDDTPPPELVAGLKDESVIVRRAAVQALHKFPLGLDPAIPILLAELEASELDPKDRELARALLRAAWPTPTVVPALAAALESGRGDVRSAAALLLGRIGPDASAAVPRLQQLLNEPSEGSVNSTTTTRRWSDPPRAAAQALGRISSSREVIGALTEILGSSLADRRDSAALGLAEMGAPARAAASSVVAAYTRWLSSPESKSGGAYALSLAMERLVPHSTAEADGVQALVAGLDCANESTFQCAAKALGKFGKPAARAVPSLRALKDKTTSAYIREVAAASLQAIEAASADATTEKRPR